MALLGQLFIQTPQATHTLRSTTASFFIIPFLSLFRRSFTGHAPAREGADFTYAVLIAEVLENRRQILLIYDTAYLISITITRVAKTAPSVNTR